MPVLTNPQHEVFCQAVASGMEAQDAYMTVFTHCSKRSANSAGPRLFAKVVARVRELQSQSATALVLTMQERREMLAVAARTVVMPPRDLAAVLRIDAELAGDLVAKVEQKDTTDRALTPERRAELLRESIARRAAIVALPDAREA